MSGHLTTTLGEGEEHRETEGPPDQNVFGLRFFGRRQLLREKPSIGGRSMRLSTAKDEKISSRSMF